MAPKQAAASAAPQQRPEAAEPKWLNEREQAAWRGYIRMNILLLARLNRDLNNEFGLSDSDYAVLVNLSEAADERMRSFELAKAVQWEKSRLSHHLTRMEKRGFVERLGCPTDARGAFIAITDAGRAAITAAAPRHVETVRRLFIDRLTASQLETLEQIANTVLETLDDCYAYS